MKRSNKVRQKMSTGILRLRDYSLNLIENGVLQVI